MVVYASTSHVTARGDLATVVTAIETYINTIEEGVKMGYTESECSIIVETNQRMIGALEHLQAERYKTYRFYQKELSR